MRKILLMAALMLSASVFAQKKAGIPAKYAAGTVPVKDGVVTFCDTFELPGVSKSQIYSKLQSFSQSLVKNENSLPQSRILTNDEKNGLIAVNMEEWMYFKRKAWVTNATRFYYQLLFQVKDGGYVAILRNIRYLYDEERNGGQTYSAENWITDDAAIVKKGKKLSRYSGKFRTKTIDRKDELFRNAYSAAGGKIKKKVKKIIYEEVEE